MATFIWWLTTYGHDQYTKGYYRYLFVGHTPSYATGEFMRGYNDACTAEYDDTRIIF